jgi:thioredoxin-dependent peroxiredoxin
MNLTITAFVITGILLAGTRASGEEAMIVEGTQAPDFTLQSDKGDTIRLSDYKNKNHVVLIFYPGDETPGCTKQLCAIRDDYGKFQAKGVVVFGVNPADKDSHRRFAEKQKYQFPLLVDTDQKTAALYGARGLSVKRTVFVIDPQGKIVFARQGMPSDEEILAAIQRDKKP